VGRPVARRMDGGFVGAVSVLAWAPGLHEEDLRAQSISEISKHARRQDLALGCSVRRRLPPAGSPTKIFVAHVVVHKFSVRPSFLTCPQQEAFTAHDHVYLAARY
jgi:hypothetical protein